MERKFPQTKPRQRKSTERKPKSTKMPGLGASLNQMAYNRATKQNTTLAVRESRRIPNLMTRVPFKKVERPMEKASPAKMKGKFSSKPYWSTNICWAELR